MDKHALGLKTTTRYIRLIEFANVWLGVNPEERRMGGPYISLGEDGNSPVFYTSLADWSSPEEENRYGTLYWPFDYVLPYIVWENGTLDAADMVEWDSSEDNAGIHETDLPLVWDRVIERFSEFRRLWEEHCSHWQFQGIPEPLVTGVQVHDLDFVVEAVDRVTLEPVLEFHAPFADVPVTVSYFDQ